MRYDSSTVTGSTPAKTRTKSRSRQRRDAVELLTRRRAFLERRAAALRAAGNPDHLERRDIALIDVAAAVLSGSAAPPVEDLRHALRVLRDRADMLRGEVERKGAADSTFERREIGSLTFVVDELARAIAERS